MSNAPSSFFSIYWFRHHRDLHSFPTRRSSDLPRSRPAPTDRPPAHRSSRRPRVREPSSPRTTARRRGFPRSEEHTSELQSRPHLVCRLLLEKKKYDEIARRSKPVYY